MSALSEVAVLEVRKLDGVEVMWIDLTVCRDANLPDFEKISRPFALELDIYGDEDEGIGNMSPFPIFVDCHLRAIRCSIEP